MNSSIEAAMLDTADVLVSVVIGALVTAVIGGVLGGLLSVFWDAIKRQRESDLASRDAFYGAYSEFFTTWKLWDAYVKDQVSAPDDAQWRLLERAEGAEATFEALLVKVASERHLDASDEACLAAFRHGYQSLRVHIRKGERLKWWSVDIGIEMDLPQYREYAAFKALAEYFASLIAEKPRWFRSPIRRQRRVDYASALCCWQQGAAMTGLKSRPQSSTRLIDSRTLVHRSTLALDNQVARRHAVEFKVLEISHRRCI